MLTTIWIFALLGMLALILGAESPTGTADAAAQDEDEQELIASVGDDVAPPVKAEDDDDDEPEPASESAESSAESKDDEPAAPKPDAPVDTASGGSGDEPGVPEAVQPEPAAARIDPGAVKPSAKPKPSRAAQRLAEVEATILKEDFDPYTVDGRKLQLEHNHLAAQVANEPIANNQFWITESVTHGIPRKDLENVALGIQAQYEKDYPHTDPAYWQIAAKKDYDVAVAAMKLRTKPAAEAPKPVAPKPPAPKAVAPTPITPKGARVAPPAAVVPPPPKPKSDEEELVESVRRESKSGVRI